MRTLNAAVKAELNKQYGVEPLFIVGIQWDGDLEETFYCSQEIPALSAYNFIKSYSDIQSFFAGDGYGSITSVDVDFLDDYGHFKTKMENFVPLDNKASVYITAYGLEEKTLLFEGKISFVQWEESERVFKTTIELVNEETLVGYTPNILDVSPNDPNYASYMKQLITQPWPIVCGSVRKMPLTKVANAPMGKLKEKVDYDPNQQIYNLTFEAGHSFTEGNVTKTLLVIGQSQYFFSYKVTGTFGPYVENEEITFTYNKSTTVLNFYDAWPASLVDSTHLAIGTPSDFPWVRNMWLHLTDPEYGVVKTQAISQIDNIVEINVPIPVHFVVTSIDWARKITGHVKSYAEGTTFILADWLPDRRYIIGTDTDVTVSKLMTKFEGAYQRVPASMYEIKTGAPWQGAPNCTYLELNEKGHLLVYETWHSGSQGSQSELFFVNASTPRNTDQKVVNHLIEKYEGRVVNVFDSSPRTVNFGLLQTVALKEILNQVLWQSRKAYQSSGEDVNLIALDQRQAPKHTFNQDNIFEKSVTLSYTHLDDIFTVMDFTVWDNDWSTNEKKLRKITNVNLYGKRILESEIYIFNDMGEAENTLDYWSGQLCDRWHKASFVGFLDGLHLQVWDTIQIDFENIAFYDVNDGSPFEVLPPSSANGQLLSGKAIIEEINVKANAGLIEYIVRFFTR